MNLGFIFGEVWQGLRRNASMVISVVLVTFVSLTFVGSAILLQMQIDQMKGYWYDKAQVVVYLCTDNSENENCIDGAVDETRIAEIEQVLKTPPLASFVESYQFENSQEAYDRFLVEFAGSAAASWVTPETLNQAFWVNLVNPDQADVVIESLGGQLGVEEVSDQRVLLEDIFLILNIASITAIAIAGLMLVAAILLISTTIRLSAFSRRREINIMRLVGASNGFIQTPFVIEGIIAALIGSVLASAATMSIIVFFVQGYLTTSWPATAFVTFEDALITVPIIIGIGVVLSALAANFAISRYLKV
ncbi:MAG: permease-like cell division protein FtsX [Microbacteriaceae bacterium]